MQIITWNVNGIRAALRKGALDWITAQAAEVLCLQEVRARKEQVEAAQLRALQEHFPYVTWNAAERGGYSGVATFSRLPPKEVTLGLEVEAFDVEGRVICTRYPGFLLFNIYFPNGGREHARVPFKLDFYARLLKLCDELHAQGENIILTGDFNTSHQEIDLRNARANQNSTGFLPEERAWIDRYLTHGFVDVFRQHYPDREQYTWWTFIGNARARNVGWRLDYFLISEGLVDRVEDVMIHDDVMGSDHCPVSLFINGQHPNP
jgi:exodeoxyribonuclease-3